MLVVRRCLGYGDPKQTTALQASPRTFTKTIILHTHSHSLWQPCLFMLILHQQWYENLTRLLILLGVSWVKAALQYAIARSSAKMGNHQARLLRSRLSDRRWSQPSWRRRYQVSKCVFFIDRFLILHSLLPNCSFILSFIIRTLSNSIAPFPLNRTLMSSSSYAKMALWQMSSGNENILPCPRFGGTSSRLAEQ